MQLKSITRRQRTGTGTGTSTGTSGWANAATSEEVGLAIVGQIQKNLDAGNVKLLGLKLELTWCGNLPITHCAPVGKKTMWGAKYAAERSQQVNPGFRGRVWFLYNKPPQSATLKHARFHTGTGGYGSYGGPFTPGDGYPLSYDCQLFAEDWPVLRETIEVEIAMRRVADDKTPITLNFEWRAEHDERS